MPKINWTRVLAATLCFLALGGYVAALLLEGQYVQWFLGCLITLVLFRVETLIAEVRGLPVEEESDYEA